MNFFTPINKGLWDTKDPEESPILPSSDTSTVMQDTQTRLDAMLAMIEGVHQKRIIRIQKNWDPLLREAEIAAAIQHRDFLKNRAIGNTDRIRAITLARL